MDCVIHFKITRTVMHFYFGFQNNFFHYFSEKMKFEINCCYFDLNFSLRHCFLTHSSEQEDYWKILFLGKKIIIIIWFFCAFLMNKKLKHGRGKNHLSKLKFLSLLGLSFWFNFNGKDIKKLKKGSVHKWRHVNVGQCLTNAPLTHRQAFLLHTVFNISSKYIFTPKL